MRNLILSCVLLISAASTAQPLRRPVTMKDFLEIKLPSDLQFSPDGRTIAFVVSESDFEKSATHTSLWLVGVTDTTGGSSARPLTRYRQAARLPRWSPNGKYLAFLDDGRGEEKTELKEPQIWLLPAAGGEAVQATQAQHGIMSYDWMPNSRAVVYLTEQEEQAELLQIKKQRAERKFDAVEVDKDRRVRQVWRLDIAGGNSPSGGKPVKLFDGDFGIESVDVSPDGERVLYRTNYTGKKDDDRKFDYWLYSFREGKTKQLTNRPGEESAARWSPDSRSVVCIAPFDPLCTYSRLDLFSVTIGGNGLTALGNPHDRSVSGVAWAADGKTVYYTLASGVEENAYGATINPTAVGRGGAGRIRQVLAGARVYEHLTVAPRGATLAVTAGDGTHAPEIYVRDLKTGTLKQLTRLNAEIDSLVLSRPEVVKWQSADGVLVEGLLIIPPDHHQGGRVPLITIPHGGPFWRNRLALHELDEAHVYAANGYAVFLPNFRGSDGYGHGFGVANYRDLGYGDFYDVMTGIDFLIAEGIADAQKLGIVGGSYGGYMTNWAISHSERFTAAVSRYGIFSLITDFSNSNIPSWEPDYLGDFYWNDPAAYARHSPSTNADRIHTPVLILHGQEDPNTFISNSQEMYTALMKLGRTVEFVTLPREEHGFREPNHQLDVVQRTLDWFDRYLRNIGYDRAAAFKVGDSVPGPLLTLRVLSATRGRQYAGQQPEAEFLEVTLEIVGSRDSDKVSVSLPADILLVDSSGHRYAAIGAPAEIAGSKVLTRGTLAFAAKKMPTSTSRDADEPLRVAAAAVFDVPATATGLKLKVLDFPLVALEK